MTIKKRRIYADDELVDETIDETVDFDEDMGEEFEDVDIDVDVDPDASALLFEAEDVAELVAEVAQAPVEVTVDEDSVVFSVNDEDFTVTPNGDEEVVSSYRIPKKSRRISASRKPARRPATKAVTASKKVPTKTQKTIRKVPHLHK